MYVYVFVCVQVSNGVFPCSICMQICVSVYESVCMYVHACMHTNLCARMTINDCVKFISNMIKQHPFG